MSLVFSTHATSVLLLGTCDLVRYKLPLMLITSRSFSCPFTAQVAVTIFDIYSR